MKLNLRAPAKVNLGLEVTGRRADGYHELRSILVNVDVVDLLMVEPGQGTVLSGDGLPPESIRPERELASRALRALEAVAGRSLGVGLRVRKQIPLGAGLGGGSADAAAVLRAAPNLGLELRQGHLQELALDLGADVPFQLAGGAALVGGIGELVEALPYREIWMAIAFGRVHVGTAAVFEELRPDEWTSGKVVEAAAELWRESSPDLMEALDELPNMLWPAATRRQPGPLNEQAAALTESGWRPRLTGSGSAMFQICRDAAEAHRLALAGATAGFTTWACRTIRPPEV
ncbi:MAG TPA: 4-(cytidine 5'-diphospho)-2-C-methyl-D-erythritol kinase [Candidatus Solibacter sp.]|nr:4-(cytidine 5'-diphospho)-2-C-methyl-D-erythritol kinase [Candidatus Solibacter sp.]